MEVYKYKRLYLRTNIHINAHPVGYLEIILPNFNQVFEIIF